jgi:hypothetical protein
MPFHAEDHIVLLNGSIKMFNNFFFFLQNVKAYLRRGTARESLLFYKDAAQGEFWTPDFFIV